LRRQPHSLTDNVFKQDWCRAAKVLGHFGASEVTRAVGRRELCAFLHRPGLRRGRLAAIYHRDPGDPAGAAAAARAITVHFSATCLTKAAAAVPVSGRAGQPCAAIGP